MRYRLDHIALLVRDLDESVAFLTGSLGLVEIPNPMGGTAIRWIEIGDGRRFHVQAGDISRIHVEKQTHFALSAGAEFDNTLARFHASGIPYADMAGTRGSINTRPDGMRATFLQDPNGYWFEINDWQPEG
jgi:lactoylglutathione lyase